MECGSLKWGGGVVRLGEVWRLGESGEVGWSGEWVK